MNYQNGSLLRLMLWYVSVGTGRCPVDLDAVSSLYEAWTDEVTLLVLGESVYTESPFWTVTNWC